MEISSHLTKTCTVEANLSLPTEWWSTTTPITAGGLTPPAGGLVLRFRAPAPHTGKMKAVTVGGALWPHFDPAKETVVFTDSALSNATTVHGMSKILVSFSGCG